MEPVAIARITDQGKFIVDNDKLVEIFGSLKDKDLSIISVAGSYRTGKSFMLNFFIRYLREHGWENSNWLGSDDKKLQDGFDWKRGSHPHRNGINVWPEIFDVLLENGKKVSVMIVDTQGLFDIDNTPDTNAKIMSISTLLCSHQILNIQHLIQERDLEHLQLSVEYACAAVGLQREKRKQRTTFQKLTFLIRDWVNDDEYQYGNGGDEYLDTTLKVKSKSNTVNDVKESVHRAFNEVKGFLMPLPGKNVLKGEKSTLTNADIEPIFREYTMQLTEAVLHPRNLILKQMFGKPISASALMNLLGAVSNSFRDGKLPEIGTMLENTVRANNDEAVQRAVRRYKEVMTELVHVEIADTDVLREFHDNAVDEATITFYEISTLGEESDRDKAHQHAIKECEDYYRIVEQENETRKSKVIEEINNLSSAMETQYIETMGEHDLTKLLKKDLERINKTLSDSILLEFDRQTKDWLRVMPSVIKNKRKALEQRLSTNYKMFEKRRLYAEEKKELEKQIDKLSINEKASDVLSKFQETFSKYANEYCMDIENLQKTEYKEGLRQYDSLTRNYDDVATVKNTREKLSRNMEQYFTNHVKRVNENNKRDLGLKYGQHVENAVNEYDRLMKQITSDGKWEMNNDFIRKHKGYKEEAAKGFNRLIANISPSLPHEDVQEYRQKLDNKMEERFNSIHKQSNDNNRHLQEVKETMKSGQFVQEALNIYETEMNELLTNDAFCDNLQAENSKFQKKAEDKFKELCSSISCDTEKDLKNLKSLMDNRFKVFKRNNENKKNAACEKKKRQEITEAVNKYCEDMNTHISQNCFPPDDKYLTKKHEELKEKALTSFESALGSNNINDGNKKELGQQIEDKFSIFKINNKTEQAKVKLQQQEHDTNKSKVETTRQKAYNRFVSAMRNHTQKYNSEMKELCGEEKTTAMELFDQETKSLKTKMLDIVQKERNTLNDELDGHIKSVNKQNEDNMKKMELEQKNFINGLAQEYQLKLNEVLSNVTTTDTALDSFKEQFIKDKKSELEGYPASVSTKAKEEIQKKTTEAKRQNEENKKHRSVEVEESLGWKIFKGIGNAVTYPFRKIVKVIQIGWNFLTK
uniref:uncharacterized protein PFB0145c-like isoform X2 n=1 Tax=Styela clava TaxID=7725 RepID=UPI0019396543|nr:uncharacterized protein PFB0145c-like isoform X2 [Styela clava]